MKEQQSLRPTVFIKILNYNQPYKDTLSTQFARWFLPFDGKTKHASISPRGTNRCLAHPKHQTIITDFSISSVKIGLGRVTIRFF